MAQRIRQHSGSTLDTPSTQPITCESRLQNLDLLRATMMDNYPLYATIDLLLGDEYAALTIMYRHTRFHIQAMIKDLCGSQEHLEEQSLEQQSYHIEETLDHDHNFIENLEERMVEICIPDIQRLASQIPQAGTTSLSSYFSAATFSFTISNEEGCLKARLDPDDSSHLEYLAPKLSQSNMSIKRAFEQGIRCIEASGLEVIRAEDADEQEQNEYPRIVHLSSTQQKYYFKAALDRLFRPGA